MYNRSINQTTGVSLSLPELLGPACHKRHVDCGALGAGATLFLQEQSPFLVIVTQAISDNLEHISAMWHKGDTSAVATIRPILLLCDTLMVSSFHC